MRLDNCAKVSCWWCSCSIYSWLSRGLLSMTWVWVLRVASGVRSSWAISSEKRESDAKLCASLSIIALYVSASGRNSLGISAITILSSSCSALMPLIFCLIVASGAKPKCTLKAAIDTKIKVMAIKIIISWRLNCAKYWWWTSMGRAMSAKRLACWMIIAR